MTRSRQAIRFRKIAGQVIPGLASIAAITAACYPFHPDLAIVGCFYLLLVILFSAFVNFAASAVVSLFAIFCLDYFFVPPLLTLSIDRPANVFALLTFLATSLVITRLASRARDEADKANARRKDLARLYELASKLVALGPDVAVKRGYLNLFRGVFDLRAMCLFDGVRAALACDGQSNHHLSLLTRNAYISGKGYDDPDRGIAVRCLWTGSRNVGAAGFEGLSDGEAMAGSLAVLAAAMIQRAHSFEAASEAAAATQVEVLRSAILDAFAHQFKTPLAAILTAAGGIREAGPLVPAQEEMVETIEAQSAGLGKLTTKLLRMARLDRDEIKPRLQFTDLSALVDRITGPYRHEPNGHCLVLDRGADPVNVMSDPDMLSLAVIQLLDNAFRYSPPGSVVTVAVEVEADAALIRVTNQGGAILPEEEQRIFDRFYRGAASHQVSGTGLGLYVARKIVSAHGGNLELDSRHYYGNDTTFCLRLPLAKEGARHELKAS